MRVVLDTTILVRAGASPHGLARHLLLAIITAKHPLILSNEMLHELAKVLRYPRVMAIHRLPETQIYDFVEFLRETAEIIPLNPVFTAPIRDVNDLIVLQTAVIGEADVICTTDRDFFQPPASVFLHKLGIAVTDDIDLIKQLRS
ncbi:MAG: putative toxin-antitoxin system toxin component, PIN family [Terriglobia bacterium]